MCHSPRVAPLPYPWIRSPLPAKAEKSGIGGLGWPFLLVLPPCLPFRFDPIDIPARSELFRALVGLGPQAYIKKVELAFLVLELGIEHLPLLGFEDLKEDPLDCFPFFLNTHLDGK